MILALVLLVAAVWGITYLITDILYTILDPRIRIGGGSMREAVTWRWRPRKPRHCHAPVEPTPASAARVRTNFSARQAALLPPEAGGGRAGAWSCSSSSVRSFAPLLAPTGYADANLMDANKFPSREFPFGTDTIGHDMLSRVIYGIRTSLLVGFAAVGVACLIGMPLGLAAGLQGGWLDFIVLRHRRDHDRVAGHSLRDLSDVGHQQRRRSSGSSSAVRCSTSRS